MSSLDTSPNRPAYDPSQSYQVETADLEYRRTSTDTWLARVYRPNAPGPFPALIDVHGGAWSAGDRTNNALMDRGLAASGLVVVAIDFRLAPAHPYPASMQDLNYATRWLKANATTLGADPTNLGALGSSSGGHMAMLSAMRPGDARYTALSLDTEARVDASVAYILALWPILDPYARYLFTQQTEREDLARRTEGYFGSTDVMREANPQLILDRREPADRPPVLVVQGTADDNLPVAIVERFVSSYCEAGGTVDLEIFPGMPHGFGNKPGPESERAVDLMKRFIARQLAAAVVPG
jgi:acetyl esterase/lipase